MVSSVAVSHAMPQLYDGTTLRLPFRTTGGRWTAALQRDRATVFKFPLHGHLQQRLVVPQGGTLVEALHAARHFEPQGVPHNRDQQFSTAAMIPLLCKLYRDHRISLTPHPHFFIFSLLFFVNIIPRVFSIG